uniref:T9SS type A sorting domain-containing protein n=1 Tax=Ignavibacterium album TaxID=591197 RepID=A0A7V2ZIP6_9BACT
MRMKILLWVFITLASIYKIIAQPLNGNYTIGGNSPDFATLQLAADALNARGVSGPVFFNIRPGVYSENGGNNTVLLLDSIVVGLSETNRITFQPDAASGGNVENVILEMNITNTSTANAALVLVYLDFITFNDLTFQENDSSLHLFNNRFIDLQTSSFFNPLLEGIVFESCKFIGSNPSGTENGIYIGNFTKDISVRSNTFLHLLNGVITNQNFNSTGNLIIEDNQFISGWRSFSGAGDPLGSAIQANYQNLFIRRNTIDFDGSATGGYQGISAIIYNGMHQVVIEQNLIIGYVHTGLKVQSSGGGQADSILVANNMINVTSHPLITNAGGFGIFITANNSKIAFNTLAIYGGSFTGFGMYGDDCKVFNNIFIIKPSYGFCLGYGQGYASQSINLQSDYNVIFSQLSGSGTLVPIISDGVWYSSLTDYQNATGLDTNSVSKDIEFVAPDDLHLTDCQSQDPELRGIPIAGITIDFDEEIRNATSPMVGADENNTRMNDMFGEPFITELSGTAFSIAAAKYDNFLADGLAIPDYDNNQVLLYHNNDNQTFSLSGTLQTLYPPTVVKFFDIDEDNNLDLIIGLDANSVQISFGDGTGGFPLSLVLESPGRVRSMEVGILNSIQEPRLFLTIEAGGGFPPLSSFLGFIEEWQPGYWDIWPILEPGTNNPDTIHSVMDDFAIANFDSEPNQEIFALTAGTLGDAYIFNDTIISGSFHSYATHYRYIFGNIASYGTSSIEIDDFDGDGDNDILSTGYDSDELILIKNQGDLVFSDEEIITRQTEGFVVMDYENDGDKDIVTMNRRLETNGITVFLNDGQGNFIVRENCYFPYADGVPWSIIASDFDLDGRTDIAITSTSDSLYVLYNLGGGTVGVRDQEVTEIPTSFSLSQNFPNPFNPTTTIQYSLPQAEDVTLKVYNLLGEEVKTLVNDYQQAGKHSVQINVNNLPSGVYFYRIQAGNFVQTKKMILIK